MPAPKMRTPIARLFSLLTLVAALCLTIYLPSKATAKTICCLDCDPSVMVCIAHCPGSGGRACQSNCQSQFEQCMAICNPDC